MVALPDKVMAMPPLPRAKLSSMLVICVAAGLSFLAGCGDEDPVSPTTTAPPIEIRADAATYGLLGGVTLYSARLEGRTLRLEVGYGGGCRTHTFAAIGSTRFLESYPAQLAVYLRHDGGNDPCLAIVPETLTFDVTPAIQLHQSVYGARGPFYIQAITPGTTEPPRVLVR